MRSEEVFLLTEGDLVRVNVLKSGYWHDEKTGRFAGIAKNGRIKVIIGSKVRLYNVENVKRRAE